ncbi:hypothetical protein Leryth_023255 [Lithospermum erythrorhizon]|nr:hypothetical protein Leryth_023255 [Lithospermum erythrorhizon]
MELASPNMNKGIKFYWNKRRGYEKLNTTTTTGGRRKSRLGGVLNTSSTEPPTSHRRRRFSWRIRRLKFSKLRKACSPKKILIGLRDSYVNFMNKIANSGVIGGGYGGAAENGFGMRTLKEYDEKMIIEIYKSIIIAQGHFLDAPKIGC